MSEMVKKPDVKLVANLAMSVLSSGPGHHTALHRVGLWVTILGLVGNHPKDGR